ncbi:prepilin peptidase [Erwinia sp. V71]|uniref:prepilin peptidase n=1 Tax=Erwinia sp. V71 TaxID=3369424 RepID=UPI003F6262C5
MDKLLVAPAIIAGALLGSFLCLAIARFPQHACSRWWLLRLCQPASCCDHCGARIRWRDLIPLVSLLLLRGACRDCHQTIARHHFVVECICALGLGALVLLSPSPALFIWLMLFSGIALLLSEIDRRRLLLPDVLTGPLLWLGLMFHIVLLPDAVASAVTGAIAGYLALRLLASVYALIYRRQGMGRGDAKYLAAIGAWTGVFSLPLVVTMAAALGIAGWLLTGGWRRKATRQPFGPCLSLAGWWVLIAQHGSTDWLTGLFKL